MLVNHVIKTKQVGLWEDEIISSGNVYIEIMAENDLINWSKTTDSFRRTIISLNLLVGWGERQKNTHFGGMYLRER